MLPLMSNVAALLLSASTIINPTTPQALSFDASAYINASNQIRLAVQKSTGVPVVVLLRDKDNQVLYYYNIGKKEAKYAVKLDVNELPDGQYELEVKSTEGSIRKQLSVATAPTQQTTRLVAVQ